MIDNAKAANIIARTFMATGFTYFLISTILLALNITTIISVRNDPIFIMDLYGFVTFLIFGLSYIFLPGLSRSRFANYKTMILEYLLMNFGVIALVVPLLTGIFRHIIIIGAISLVLGVVMHFINIWSMLILKTKPKIG